jgi:RNA polymerase sigma-70 factor (ECF subfamily)
MEELGVSVEDERDLVERARGGSEKAFRRILETHHRLVFAAVRGIAGQGIDTDDVVQEVFIKVFRALGDFRSEARLSTWIYRIARNEALNALARRKPAAVPIEDCADLAAPGDDPETAHGRRLARERLERLMENLDEPERVALELRYRGEKSYEEIAAIMEIPLGTVKTHIYRGKLSLKRMIERREAGALRKGTGAR